MLLCAGTAWALRSGEDPQVAKVQALRAQIENAPEDQRRDLFRQMRQEFETMSPEAREAMFAKGFEERQSRERKRMDEFFAMTTAQQVAALDKEIDRDQERRKRWEQRQKNGQNTRTAGGGGGGGPGGPGGRGQGGPGGGWRGGGGRGGNSAQRQKSYLDRTSPMDRASATNIAA